MIIKVKFTEVTTNFPVAFGENTKLLPAKLGEIQTVNIGAVQYKGAYIVTPKLEEQILPTKDKLLKDDMTVKGIEIHRVKNSSGGTTVYIAKGV